MSTLRLCNAHVNQLRVQLTAQGVRDLLPPPDRVLTFDLSTGVMPDVLCIAISHLLVRVQFAGLIRGEAREEVEGGACVACCVPIEDWFETSATDAIELFLTHLPPAGRA